MGHTSIEYVDRTPLIDSDFHNQLGISTQHVRPVSWN